MSKARDSSAPGVELEPAPVYETRGRELVVGEDVDHYSLEFADVLLEEEEYDEAAGGEARVLDKDGGDVLLVYPGDVRVFVGKDETATNAGVYGFTVPEDVRLETTKQCVEFLRPNRVADRFGDSKCRDPVRQGEWWFLKTDDSPGSKVFKGGLGEKPYGVSPLQSHVPRDYAFGVREEEVFDRMRRVCPFLAEEIDELDELLYQVSNNMLQWGYASSEGLVSLRELVEQVFDGVYVRGTVRHRDGEHGMVSLGEQWHRALTHGRDVYSANPNDIFDRNFLFHDSGLTLD